MPLVGFGTRLGDDKISKTLQRLIAKEKITQRDFIIRQMPELSSEGAERDLFFSSNKLKASEAELDDLNKGARKVKLEFELGKGSYATIVVKRLFQPK